MDRKTSRFDRAMHDIYVRVTKEANYNASAFLRMLSDNGGLQTARTLINSSKPSKGYEVLYGKKKLNLTVEAMILENPEWHDLFTAKELKRAKDRLRAYGYEPKIDNVK